MGDNRTTGNGALFGMGIGGLLGLLFGSIWVLILAFLGAGIGDYIEIRQRFKRQRCKE